MRQRKKVHRDRLLKILLTPGEMAVFNDAFKTTIFRTASDYARALLFGKPVHIAYRSRSLDEFITFATGIKDQLDVISRNWARKVKSLQDLPPTSDVAQTLSLILSEESELRQNIKEFKSLLLKIYEDALRAQDLRGDGQSHLL